MGRSRARRRRSKNAASRRDGGGRPPLVPWRQQMNRAVDALRAWSRDHYQPAFDAHVAASYGAEPSPERADDIERLLDDYACTAGSAGDGLSILRVFCDQAREIPAELREQARRWEKERRRGVFVVQGGGAERLVLWDPLGGAPLTLHLLEKLGSETARLARRGAVATATYQPWGARLVAVGTPELFTDPRALEMFRRETASSGARWHEPPAPAPRRSRAGSSPAP